MNLGEKTTEYADVDKFGNGDRGLKKGGLKFCLLCRLHCLSLGLLVIMTMTVSMTVNCELLHLK